MTPLIRNEATLIPLPVSLPLHRELFLVYGGKVLFRVFVFFLFAGKPFVQALHHQVEIGNKQGAYEGGHQHTGKNGDTERDPARSSGSGKVPRMKAKEVIRIGRRRTRPPSIADSSVDLPAAR